MQLDEPRASARPRPVPSRVVRAPLPDLLELLENRAPGPPARCRCRCREPTTWTSPSTSRATTSTRPRSGVNFTALDSRLKITCLTLRSSASIRSDRAIDVQAQRRSPWRLARSRTIVSPLSSASASEKVPSSSSMRPASTFDRSRMSLISDSRWRPERQDVFEVLGLLVVQLAEQPFDSTSEKPMIGVQRRAQLVAHVGQELRLVAAGHLELAALALDLLKQTRVLNGQHRLVGERLQQVDRLVAETAGRRRGARPAHR